jgi:hypothetical protein
MVYGLEVGWDMKVTTDTRAATTPPAPHRAAPAGYRAEALHTDDDRWSWTRLGVRLGLTREQSQRLEVLDGITRMAWTGPGTRHRYLAGPAARVIVGAILGHRHDQPHRVGVARLHDGRRLIGLEHTLGTRSFVLDLDVEAVHLLDQLNHRPPPIA